MGKENYNKQLLKISNLEQVEIKKPFLNRYIAPDTRISADLLDAGIDPLKFDYNYSCLMSNAQTVLEKTYYKPKPAKIRHPGVIDKF